MSPVPRNKICPRCKRRKGRKGDSKERVKNFSSLEYDSSRHYYRSRSPWNRHTTSYKSKKRSSLHKRSLYPGAASTTRQLSNVNLTVEDRLKLLRVFSDDLTLVSTDEVKQSRDVIISLCASVLRFEIDQSPPELQNLASYLARLVNRSFSRTLQTILHKAFGHDRRSHRS